MEPPATLEPAALLDDVRAASRAETRAAAQRVSGIWHLYKVRLRETGDRAQWALDTWDAVAAEVAAALNITLTIAGSYVRAFQAIVYRTDLITDPDTLAIVDVELAGRALRWAALSQGKFARQVDRIVAKADQDAVRRRKSVSRTARWSSLIPRTGWPGCNANVFATDGHAFEQRLDALAAMVCGADPVPSSSAPILIRSGLIDPTFWRVSLLTAGRLTLAC
jgi:hypothetical protein